MAQYPNLILYTVQPNFTISLGQLHSKDILQIQYKQFCQQLLGFLLKPLTQGHKLF